MKSRNVYFICFIMHMKIKNFLCIRATDVSTLMSFFLFFTANYFINLFGDYNNYVLHIFYYLQHNLIFFYKISNYKINLKKDLPFYYSYLKRHTRLIAYYNKYKQHNSNGR